MASDFANAAEKVSDLRDNLSDELSDANEESMEDTRDRVRDEVISNDSVASTELLRRIRVYRSSVEDAAVIASTVVDVPDKYRFVEHGTGAFSNRGYPAPSQRPPVGKIYAWIVEKGIQPYAYDNRYDLAEAIANTIGEIGNERHPFLRPAWFKSEPALRQQHRAAMKRAVRRSF